MRNWTKPTRTCLPADLLICHEFRARLEDVRMITVDGDSTEPLLPSGCHILIYVSTQSPVPTERQRTQILRSGYCQLVAAGGAFGRWAIEIAQAAVAALHSLKERSRNSR